MTKLMEVVALTLLIAMFALVALNWSNLPERMPSHYNASGEPDRWGSRAGVWILPIVGANLYALMTALSRSKLKLNVPAGVDGASPETQQDARQLLTAVKMLVMAAFAFITWSRISAPLQGLGRGLVPALLLVPLGVIGVYFIRMRRQHARGN